MSKKKKKKKRLPEPEPDLPFIDCHCHVPYKASSKSKLPPYDDQYDEFVEEGGLYMISCALDWTTLAPVREFKAAHNRVGYTLGWAPQNIVFMALEEYGLQWDRWLDALDTHSDYLGVGEIGLDFYHAKSLKQREKQLDVFDQLLTRTKDWGKPFILHVRNPDNRSKDRNNPDHPYNAEDAATKLVLETLEKHAIEPKRVMWHCFSGPEEYGPLLAKKGYYLSVPSSAWSRKKWRRQTKEVPVENLLTETDAYYQHPWRYGPYNTPANARYSIAAIAYSHGLDQREVAKTSVKNAIRFFNLEIEPPEMD